MRVGVIRGDVPGPIFLADLEPTSQTNFPVEPAGQTRYLSRPTSATVGAMLSASIPASLVSTGAITFPLTINGGNHTLRIRETGSYAVLTVANAIYNNITTLVAAVNAAIGVLPIKALAFSSTKLALQTTLSKGAGTILQVDSVGNGSTFNTPAVLGAGGQTKTVPTAAAFITATLPVGGPLDVSAATIRTSLGGGLTDAQVGIAADAIAPQFVETDTALKSFQVGALSGLLSASYNPDPNRLPAITPGAAVTVVADDGSTIFSSSKPVLTNAQVNTPGAGDVTLTGLGLAGAGSPNSEVVATKVKFFLPVPVTVDQYFIVAAGGTVSKTSIVLPAAVVPAGVAAGIKVQVQYTSLVSNQFTLV
jgi:hypothetical protein